MSSRKLSRAANSIENMLMELSYDYDLESQSLDEVGFSKPCYETAFMNGFFTLQDIYELSPDEIKENYNFDAGRVSTLARNIRKIYLNPNNYLFRDSTEEETQFKYEFDRKLEGWDTVEEFDKSHLDFMAEWNETRGFESKYTLNVGGFIYECDSKLEENLIRHLADDGYFKELRGQNLVISYKKRKKGKEKSYHPDIVLLNQNNHIVIVEAKPLYNIPVSDNLKKYEDLKKYCKENGYLCCMCDDGYRTIEDLKTYSIDEYIEQFVIRKAYIFGEFNYFDYCELKIEIDENKKIYKDFTDDLLKENIAATVVQHNLDFRKGNLAGGIQNLRIFWKKTSSID